VLIFTPRTDILCSQSLENVVLQTFRTSYETVLVAEMFTLPTVNIAISFGPEIPRFWVSVDYFTTTSCEILDEIVSIDW
jgi:hypothetical protein